MALPLANDLAVTEQFVKVDGLLVPWYLLPFRQRDTVHDPFEAQRTIWGRLVKDNRWNPTTEQQPKRDKNYYHLIKLNPAFAAHYTGYIRMEDSYLALFNHWTKLQRQVYWGFSSLWFFNLAVRMLILKARQEGASTLVEWLILWSIALQEGAENRSAVIMADKDQNASRIFKMTERFYTHLNRGMDDKYIPDRMTHSGWQLQFGELRRTHMTHSAKNPRKQTPEKAPGPILNSGIEVATAAAKQKERGLTASDFHGSEVAFWPDPEEVWSSLAPGLPPKPRSLVILESTANMAGDFWHAMWKAAVDERSEFLPIFSGWQDTPWTWACSRTYPSYVPGRWERKYSHDLPLKYQDKDEAKQTEKREDYLRTLSDEERLLVTDRECSLEQIEWRRVKIPSACADDPERFKREYPSTADEAFRSKGRNVFNQQAIDYYLEQCNPLKEPPPVFVGNLELDKNGCVNLAPKSNGYTRIWAKPVPGRTYVIGVDSAGGEDPSADYSSTQVVDAYTLEQVAHCFSPEGSMFHAYQTQCLARLYGDALVVSECTGLGYRMTALLVPGGQYEVANLYVREEMITVGVPMVKKYGFSTNKKTKPLMVQLTRDLLNARLLTLHCYRTVCQARDYARHQDGSYGKASPKDSDDALDALMMALAGIDSGQLRDPITLPKTTGPAAGDGDEQDAWKEAVRQPRYKNPYQQDLVHPTLGDCF